MKEKNKRDGGDQRNEVVRGRAVVITTYLGGELHLVTCSGMVGGAS